MTLTEFQQAGYQIEVTYDNTQFMQADVPIDQLADINDPIDLEYTNDDLIELSYNAGSETFTIIKPNGQAIDQEFYDLKSLKEYIAKL